MPGRYGAIYCIYKTTTILARTQRQRELITSVTAFHSTVIATLPSVFFVCLSYRNSTMPTTGHLSSFKERRTTTTTDANTSDAPSARVVLGNVQVLHALRIGGLRPTHKKQARAVGAAIKFPRDAISPAETDDRVPLRTEQTLLYLENMSQAVAISALLYDTTSQCGNKTKTKNPARAGPARAVVGVGVLLTTSGMPKTACPITVPVPWRRRRPARRQLNSRLSRQIPRPHGTSVREARQRVILQLITVICDCHGQRAKHGCWPAADSAVSVVFSKDVFAWRAGGRSLLNHLHITAVKATTSRNDK